MATTTPTTKRGFANLPCIMCSEHAVRLNLACVTDADCFTCTECDAEYGPGDVQALLDAWAPVLDWMEQAPELPN